MIECTLLQLRHPNGSLLNSNQRTIFQGFIREDERPTAVFQPRTETCMADPFITELEVRRAQDYFNAHKGLALMGLSLRPSKP